MPNINSPQIIQAPQGGGFWDTLMQLASIIPGPQQPFMQAAMGVKGALGGNPQSITNIAKQHGINGPMGGPTGTGGSPDNPNPPSSGAPTLGQLPTQQQMMGQAQGQAQQLSQNPQQQLAQQALAQGLQQPNGMQQGLQQAGSQGAIPIYPQIMAHLPPKLDTGTLAGMASLLQSGMLSGGGGGGGGFDPSGGMAAS